MGIKMKTILFTTSDENIKRVFSADQIETIKREFDCDGTVYTPEDLAVLGQTECIFSTWGMPELSEQQLQAYLPKLKYVFYAAGTIKMFAAPYYRRGVRIFSAWHANAVPVTEVTVAQILLASKGFYYLSRLCKQDYAAALREIPNYPGNYGVKVGLIGCGAIGMRVLEELKRYDMELYVSSSKITKDNERKYGVHAATREEIFETCTVISNHLANVPETVGMIGESLISKLKPYSTFINTGRGAQVDEAALARKLGSDPTVTAVLDVTYPEPPQTGHPFYTLPNCVLTPHSAGSSGWEVQRMAAYMIEECRRLLSGDACKYEVTPDMLSRMA